MAKNGARTGMVALSTAYAYFESSEDLTDLGMAILEAPLNTPKIISGRCPECNADRSEPNHFCPTCIKAQKFKHHSAGRYSRKHGTVIFDE